MPLADTLSRKYPTSTFPELSEGMDLHVHSVVLQELVEAGNSD